MSSESWNDRDLRSFVLRAPRLSWGDDTLADVQREAFRTQAVLRIGDVVRRRVLADVGVATSTEGIALLACEVLEDGIDQRRRDWLLVTAEPWDFLAEWIDASIVKSHRAIAGRAAKDAKTLEGIATVSSRKELDPGDGD